MVVGACPQTLRVIEYLTGVLITSRERWDEEIKVEAEGAETPDYSNNNSQQSDHHHHHHDRRLRARTSDRGEAAAEVAIARGHL